MVRAIAAELDTRRAALAEHAVLARLAEGLTRHLERLCSGPLYFPDAKALLSRDGGVCARDGARLEFDPFAPQEHRCGRCGAVYEGERHHRAWVTRYQIWLSERAVHCALLGALLERNDLAACAAGILAGYADRYRGYPNADNVLGPTRLFFSTYLESIWLVQLSCAAALLESAAPDRLSAREWDSVRTMARESAALIASFDERGSNRQVWNDAALVAVGGWLGDRHLAAHGRSGPSGLATHLGAVDADGWWPEGENYHFFALRGFALAAELLRWQGYDAYAGTRLGLMFAAPLATLLPDLTIPARGDAPYGVSVRQRRFADLWELGRARTDDPRLDAALRRLYATDVPDGPDVGLVELAEQEQNRPAARQHRDRLGWKALLWMRPDDPASNDVSLGASQLLETQGIAVLHPAPRNMVTLECGRRGSGHAHPDRLHLSVFRDGPLLMDFGTGSYVQRSLHWYRSALAHNAPGEAWVGQQAAVVWCDAFAEQEGWHWCRARADALFGEGTRVTRSVVVGPDWVLDVVTVEAPPEVVVDLPIHLLGTVRTTARARTEPERPAAAAGHETGYDFLRDVARLSTPYEPLTIGGAGGGWLLLVPRAGEVVLAATAPGPPGADFAEGAPLRFLIRRAPGPGRWIQVFGRIGAPEVAVEEASQGIAVRARGSGGVTRLRETERGLRVEGPGVAIDLPARRVELLPLEPRRTAPSAPDLRLRRASVEPSLDSWPEGGVRFTLGAGHYRRSERAYGAAGPFSAHLDVAVRGDAVWFRVAVTKSEVVVRPAGAPDPRLDNESPDIHSDGVQCYVGRDGWEGYVILPDFESGALRVRAVAGTAGDARRVTGRCRRTAAGYDMLLRCDAGAVFHAGDRVRFTVTVNEMQPGRERRAGQLALAGGGWVYLRGDRETSAAALVAEIA
jgi:hypothetical protein